METKDKTKKTSQDIRIVQFKNYSGFFANSERGGYRTFSYFDEIMVHSVPAAKNLYDGYIKMQDLVCANSKKRHRSQQFIMAFTDVKNRRKANEIDRFWETEETALLFLTLVNVSPYVSLEDTEKHIQKCCKEQNHLIYRSFEYNEILIFCKTDSFEKYMNSVTRLNYTALAGESSPVLDTITICGFGKKSRKNVKDKIDAHLCLGATDYQELQNYLKTVKTQLNLPVQDLTIQTNQNVNPRWTIGRNDTSIFLSSVTFEQLYKAYIIYANQYAKYRPFISTLDLTIWPRSNENDCLELTSPTALNLSQQSHLPKLYETIKEMERRYKQLYKKLESPEDMVFLRFLYDLENMVTNSMTIQLAKDFSACLVPQLQDFIKYMTKVCTTPFTESSDNDLKDLLEETVNNFYLSIITLVNSTVHSNRQFIQIPHCGVTAFEMPPKLMAYYGIMARSIVSVLTDPSEDILYGVMLSPKLVDELAVDSMPLKKYSEPDHMISVSISEEMFYHPRRTTQILGHEIAHFAGNLARLRNQRRQLIIAYHIQKILEDLLTTFQNRLGGATGETLDQVLDPMDLLNFSKRLAEEMFPFSSEQYALDASLNQLKEQIRNLGPNILQDEESYNIIVNTLLFPVDKKPLFQQSLDEYMNRLTKGFLDTQKTNADNLCSAYMLKLRGEALFADISNTFITEWNKYKNEQAYLNFKDVTSYLFSESYADICMLLLYDMPPKDYLDLFVNGRKNDAAELARFRAVVRAMRKKNQWVKQDVPRKNNCKDKWEMTLHLILSLSLEEEWTEEYTKRINRTGHPIDWVLQSVLTEYLEQCIEALQNHFSQFNKATELEELRRIYQSVDPDSSACDAVVIIRELEQKQLYID